MLPSKFVFDSEFDIFTLERFFYELDRTCGNIQFSFCSASKGD